MNKLIILVFTCLSFSNLKAQTEEQKVLFGSIKRQELHNPPFNNWFDSGYNSYHPNEGVMRAVKKSNLKDISIKIFFGTWCGDSKREVPRFLKLLDEISFPGNKVQLIAVGRDTFYKQSPQHEEIGLGIFRVPTIIFYKKGIEINRINEAPCKTLERDLLDITTTNLYQPNINSLAVIQNWLHEGVLTDPNFSDAGLTGKLRSLVANENELNSVSNVLFEANQKTEALKILMVNRMLYPLSFKTNFMLGKAFYFTGEKNNALIYFERSLLYTREAKEIHEILDQIYKVKGF